MEVRSKRFRSALFLPASNPRAIAKVPDLRADAVIYDLEDAVGIEDKDKARDAAVSAVTVTDQFPYSVIRINDPATSLGKLDFEAVINSQADAILIPKIRTPSQVNSLIDCMQEQSAGQALWLMLETPSSVVHAAAICAEAAKRQGSTLVVGPNDLARESRMRPGLGREELVPVLVNLVMAARTHDLNILDGVYNAFRDLDGFITECIQARRLGMDGKTLIHPSQIDPCNHAFSPTDEELTFARSIVAEFERPENIGVNVLQIGGEMVERLHYEEALLMLDQND